LRCRSVRPAEGSRSPGALEAGRGDTVIQEVGNISLRAVEKRGYDELIALMAANPGERTEGPPETFRVQLETRDSFFLFFPL
jgi:hypothetical protein